MPCRAAGVLLCVLPYGGDGGVSNRPPPPRRVGHCGGLWVSAEGAGQGILPVERHLACGSWVGGCPIATPPAPCGGGTFVGLWVCGWVGPLTSPTPPQKWLGNAPAANVGHAPAARPQRAEDWPSDPIHPFPRPPAPALPPVSLPGPPAGGPAPSLRTQGPAKDKPPRPSAEDRGIVPDTPWPSCAGVLLRAGHAHLLAFGLRGLLLRCCPNTGITQGTCWGSCSPPPPPPPPCVQ